MKEITKDVVYIGVDDPTQHLFESQYHTPEGMCYNSYVIIDEKVAVMDTSDSRTMDEWKANLATALDGRQPDYLVVHHLEPACACSGSAGTTSNRTTPAASPRCAPSILRCRLSAQPRPSR